MHSDRLLDYFRNPRNAGELPGATVAVEVTNPVCGDTLKLFVRWADERAEAVTYKCRGCVAAIGCGSALTELLSGKTKDELTKLRQQDVIQAVGGLAPESGHAAALCVDAVKALIRQLAVK